MYHKKPQGWVKHFDFIIGDMLCLQVAFVLAYLTGMEIHWLFALCQTTEVLKAIFGAILLKRGTWVRRLVGEPETAKTKN